MTDGSITQGQLRGIATEHGMSPYRLQRAIATLVEAERFRQDPENIFDTNFAKACMTRDERLERREQWTKAQRTRRSRLSSDDSTGDIPELSSVDDPLTLTPFRPSNEVVPSVSKKERGESSMRGGRDWGDLNEKLRSLGERMAP